MRVDGSLKFIQSREAQIFTTVNDLYNNWPDTEIARDILLGKILKRYFDTLTIFKRSQ